MSKNFRPNGRWLWTTRMVWLLDQYLTHVCNTGRTFLNIILYIVDHNRYLAVVCTEGCQDTEESVILGIDVIDETSTVGLVLSIWGDSKITLDGDG